MGNQCDWCASDGALRDFGGTLCDSCYNGALCVKCRVNPRDPGDWHCDDCFAEIEDRSKAELALANAGAR